MRAKEASVTKRPTCCRDAVATNIAYSLHLLVLVILSDPLKEIRYIAGSEVLLERSCYIARLNLF
jgi:hypothetical protein